MPAVLLTLFSFLGKNKKLMAIAGVILGIAMAGFYFHQSINNYYTQRCNDKVQAALLEQMRYEKKKQEDRYDDLLKQIEKLEAERNERRIYIEQLEGILSNNQLEDGDISPKTRAILESLNNRVKETIYEETE